MAKNQAIAIVRQHQAEQPKDVVARLAAALLACKIPDGFDRNGSHSSGTYQEYQWSLSTYLRPQDEWKAVELAKAAIAAMGSAGNGLAGQWTVHVGCATLLGIPVPRGSNPLRPSNRVGIRLTRRIVTMNE